MLDTVFSGIFNALTGISLGAFLLSMGVALGLGVVLALVYAYRATYTRGFLATLAMLPGIVCLVIMMVSGNLGAGIAVAGTFSLVRFRSVPGTAKEICAIFMAMAVGIACGMGYPVLAAVFAGVMCLVSLLLTAINFGGRKNAMLRKVLRVTVPEDLDYAELFTDIFAEYTTENILTGVKTTNLGSLNKLTYDIVLKKAGTEKAMIDAMRCRNGNLEISMSLQTTDLRDL